MLMSIRNFLLLIGLTAITIIVYGCHSGSRDKFEPPPKKQVEKKYITKNKIVSQKKESRKAPAKSTVKLPATKTDAGADTAKYPNINKVVLNHVDGNAFLTNVNFVTRWNILGPFPYKAEKLAEHRIKSVLHDILMPEEKMLTGREKAAAPAKWQLARFESPEKPGEINLRSLFKDKNDYLITYAVTYLYSDKGLPNLTLYTGGSSYIKVWINHQLVHAYDQMERQGKWDQDTIKNITLKKGYNLIVVKCVAFEKDWNFYLRLADGENLPLKFIPVNSRIKSKSL